MDFRWHPTQLVVLQLEETERTDIGSGQIGLKDLADFGVLHVLSVAKEVGGAVVVVEAFAGEIIVWFRTDDWFADLLLATNRADY